MRNDENVVKEKSRKRGVDNRRSKDVKKTSKTTKIEEDAGSVTTKILEKRGRRFDVRREIVPQLTSPSKISTKNDSTEEPR